MRRRNFITLVGGAAVWPLASHAQQPATPVIGLLHLTSLELTRENLASFRRGLGETGYIEGRNVAIEYRWAHGKNDQLATLVAELSLGTSTRAPMLMLPFLRQKGRHSRGGGW